MAAEIPPSGIRKFFDLLLTMDNVISLGVGEPDFNTPWNVLQVAIASIEKGMTMYTSNRGLAELRELLATDLSQCYHMAYCPETEMIVTTGVSEALDVAMRAVVDPGDEVLVVDPCSVSYQPEVLMAGGRSKALPCRAQDQFKITLDALMESLTPKTKVLMMNFPNNPTGGVMGADDLKAIADIVIDHNLLIISDEVHAELTYDGHHVSITAVDGLRDRTITLNGFSKAYAMIGWRFGYICASKEITDAALKIHQYVMMSAPIVALFAAIETLKNGEDAKNEMVAEYRMRRNLFVKGLNDVGLPCHLPRDAFYAFSSIEGTCLSDEEFVEQLLKEQLKIKGAIKGAACGGCAGKRIRGKRSRSCTDVLRSGSGPVF